MESIGARLKKLRLEKGLSLEEAHKKTKIHLNILKAIEDDSLIGLSPIYVKGFLKIYCKFLGVDPKDCIAGYEEPKSTAEIIKELSSAREKPVSFLKSASVKLSSFRGINKKNIFIILFILFFLISLFNLGKLISSKRSLKPRKAKLSSIIAEKAGKEKFEAAKLEKTQKIKTTTIPKDKEQSPGAVAPKSKETPAGIRLDIRAKENCWVHLKVDGEVIFHAILKKGKTESWQAKDKIELSLGNAGVIDLELNGKPIPPLGRRGQALKNILITKDEGLKVLR